MEPQADLKKKTMLKMKNMLLEIKKKTSDMLNIILDSTEETVKWK